MPGRKRVPTVLSLLRGNPSKRPINRAEPKPPPMATVPACPRWVGAAGRALWQQQAPLHYAQGTLTAVDVPAFAALCESWNMYRRACKAVADQLTHDTKNNGESIRPEITIRKQAIADFTRLASEFGMTPTARARITAHPPGADEDPVEAHKRARPPARA